MAGSRTEKVGTIFTRLTGLLKAGGIKPEDTPIWYEVYKAFPPKFEPSYSRPAVPKEIPNIFYKEDIIRARFYKTYPNAVVDMISDNPSICERFIQKYNEMSESGNFKNDDEVFQAVALTMAIPEAESRKRIRDFSTPQIPIKTESKEEESIPERDFVEDLVNKDGGDENVKLNVKLKDLLGVKTKTDIK